MDTLATRITGDQIIQLSLPDEMSLKDFELLAQWFALLEEATLYDPEADASDEQS